MKPSVNDDMGAAMRKRGGKRRIGFFGCSNEVIRVQFKDNRKTASTVTIDCPGCKHRHPIRPYWREYMEKLDADKEIHTV